MHVLQVGKDQEAQAFLGKLDNDPVIGREVDATSYFELEAMEYQRKGVVRACAEDHSCGVSPSFYRRLSTSHALVLTSGAFDDCRF